MSTAPHCLSPLRIRVGLAIRAARVARGLTQGELAGPYTAAFVSRVEHGDAIPSLSSLEVLAARLGMSLEAFFRLVEAQDDPERREQAQRPVPPLFPTAPKRTQPPRRLGVAGKSAGSSQRTSRQMER